jgi:hypothetical protein
MSTNMLHDLHGRVLGTRSIWHAYGTPACVVLGHE